MQLNHSKNNPSVHSSSYSLPVTPTQPAPNPVAQLAAGLAHDTRNMLAAMDIYCELLGGPDVLKPEHRHFLDELRILRDTSSSLLDRLLQQAVKCLHAEQEQGLRTEDASALRISPVVSDKARAAVVAANPTAPRKLVTDLAVDLASALPMLKALAGPKVQVAIDTEHCPPVALTMPQADLTRVLINLVRNAAEAMNASGSIKITASLSPQSDSILLSIEDNGPGIPLALLERIFDLQVSTPGEEGSAPRLSFRPRGLGLRIVREFVEQSGGTIRALRLPDRGSRFEVVLPVVTKVRNQG